MFVNVKDWVADDPTTTLPKLYDVGVEVRTGLPLAQEVVNKERTNMNKAINLSFIKYFH